MNAVDRDNERFIRAHVKCVQVGKHAKPFGPTHLSRLKSGQKWRNDIRARPTLCDPENARTLSPFDEPFNRRRDLAGICPQCREAYEAEARRRLGAPTVGQLVF